MTKFTIRVASPDNDTLFERKEITIDGKTVETPAKALEVSKTRGEDQISERFRGVNELYATTNRRKLEQLRRGTNEQLRDQLEAALRKTQEEELNAVCLSFEETGQIDPKDMGTMVDLMVEYGDLIIAPLMPEIASGVDSDGLDDEYFSTYEANARIFLEAVDERDPELPVLGTIPTLSRDQVENLIDLFINAGVNGFVYNLDRRTITAAAQQEELVRPLVRKVGARDIAGEIITYSINGHPAGMDTAAGSVAEYLAAFGMGVDIVGGNHIGLRADEETIEEFIAEQQDGPDTLRLLDPVTYAMTDVPVHALGKFIPEETGLDVERIQNMIEANTDEKYRYQKLINTEIIELVVDELVDSLDEDGAKAVLDEKTGVPEPVIDRLVTTREAFDAGSSQSGLGDFAD